MGNIGNLWVSISARSEAFTSGIHKAKSVLGKFHSYASGIMGSIGKVMSFVGVGGAAGAATGLILLTKNSMKSMDMIGKLSDRTKISTEDLVGFGYAAQIAGMESESFYSALDQLIRRMGDNSAEVKDAIESLGLSQEKLTKMGTAEMFYKIVDSIKGVKDVTAKANIAYSLFGRKGMDLLTLISGGSDQLKGAVKRAEELGMTYSRLDASKIEEANDRLTDMFGLLKGIGNHIAVMVSPFITDLANNISAFATKGSSAGEKMDTMLKDIVKGVANLIDYSSVLVGIWKAFRSAMEVLTVTASGFFMYLMKILKVASMIPGSGISVLAHSGFAAMEKEAETFYNTSIASFRSNIKDTKSAFNDFWTGSAVNAVNSYFDNIDKRSSDLKKGMADLGKTLQGKGVLSNMFERGEVMSNIVDSFAESLKDGKLSNIITPEGDSTLIGKSPIDKLQSMGTFREIDLSRIGIKGSGMGEEQKVKDPQLKVTNTLLKSIEAKMNGEGSMVLA